MIISRIDEIYSCLVQVNRTNLSCTGVQGYRTCLSCTGVQGYRTGLFLSKALRLFDSVGQLLNELVVALVRRQIQPEKYLVRKIYVHLKYIIVFKLFLSLKVYRLKHVCDRGSQESFPTFSMQNRWGPLLPINSPKPPTGTLKQSIC